MDDIFDKLQAALFRDAGKDVARHRIAEFIVWLLRNGNHADIVSEVIEAKKSKRSLAGAYEAVKNEAKSKAVGGCACIEDKDVYWGIVKYLRLEDCTSRSEIESYCSGNLHANAKIEAPAQSAPGNDSPFSVDIDSLFDE